jgi:Chaperone of endosialidase
MATNFDTRPIFYEDQYLGADDLNSEVGYARAELARHSLGAHTWGIAVGLEIFEKPVPGLSGQVDNYLTPGYAWDGFGRMITVLAPYKLPPDLFTSYKFDPAIDTGGKGRLLEVWLRYWEDTTNAEANAYAPCDAQGRALRALESFRFVVGPQDTPESQVLLAGQPVDAEKAVQKSNPAGSLLEDHSVPFQDWPADEVKTIWLIPVGYVRWQPVQGGGGVFVPRDPVADLAATNAFRHYAGVVSGQVEAPAGVLRLHDRGKPYSTVRTSELVWVEGDLRVEGDVRPFGRALDFRDASGQRNDTMEMFIKRTDGPGKANALQLVIGHDTKGANSFSVGPLEKALDQGGTIQTKLTVLDNGKVGIGTATPALTLDIQGDFGRTNGAATINLWGSQIGDVGNGVLFLRSGGNIVAFDGNDNVGIGTATPVSPLQVSGDVTLEKRASNNVARVLPAGATMLWNDGTWLRLNQNIDFSKPIFGVHTPGLFASTSLNVGGAGAWGDPGGGNVWISGTVGIGTTTPALKLDVRGDFGRDDGAATVHLFGSRIGDIGDGVLFLRSGGSVVAFDGANRVGIGTNAPLGKLQVTGGAIMPAVGNGPAAGIQFPSDPGGGAGDQAYIRYFVVAGETTKLMIGCENDADDTIGLFQSGAERLSIRGGSVGIGTLFPGFRLDVAGPAHASSFPTSSDARLKKNIAPLDDVLARLHDIRGISFEWNAAYESMGRSTGRREIGVLAQEVAKVFPELVTTWGDKDYLAIDYGRLAAVLVDAVNELNAKVDSIDERLRTLEAAKRAAKSKSPKEENS